MNDLPPNIRWVDVDLPGILDYKLETLASEKTVCQYEAIRLDLTDGPKRRALFSQLGGESKRVLVVTEGLLIYLKAEQVAELARDLHAAKTFQWWLIDLINQALFKMMQRSVGKQLAASNAPFQFAPAEGTKFFEPFGWHEGEFRSATDEARRLKRTMRLAWLWRIVGRLFFPRRREEFRRMSGIVLLERV
jgi:O-methyltransferase involved in polyketide biosynthesis